MGRDDRLLVRPERVAGRQRLGLRHVERSAPQAVGLVEHVQEVVCRKRDGATVSRELQGGEGQDVPDWNRLPRPTLIRTASLGRRSVVQESRQEGARQMQARRASRRRWRGERTQSLAREQAGRLLRRRQRAYEDVGPREERLELGLGRGRVHVLWEGGCSRAEEGRRRRAAKSARAAGEKERARRGQTVDVARARIDELLDISSGSARSASSPCARRRVADRRTPTSFLRLPSELAAMTLTPNGTISRAVSLASCRGRRGTVSARSRPPGQGSRRILTCP